MTSWKRLFGKKNKKAQRKLEEKYDLWIQHLHHACGGQENEPGLKGRKPLKAKVALVSAEEV